MRPNKRQMKERITPETIENFLKDLTQEKALKILQDVGIIDENGELTKPYQPESNFEP